MLYAHTYYTIPPIGDGVNCRWINKLIVKEFVAHYIKYYNKQNKVRNDLKVKKEYVIE